MRIALIACSAAKQSVPMPAADLYTGSLFRLSRAWVERRIASGAIADWGILSARHGLVAPDMVLEPYDVKLRDVDGEKWFTTVHAALMARWGGSPVYLLLAGGDYRVAVRGMSYVEDLFGSWAEHRRRKGQRRTGIGVLMRELKRDRRMGA